MGNILIDKGFAIAEAGDWLTRQGQPVAALAQKVTTCGSRIPGRLFAPDRRVLRRFVSVNRSYFALANRPFLTRIELLADDPVSVLTDKLLLAPTIARQSSRMVRIIPMSFRGALMVTTFMKGDAIVTATKGRTTMVSVPQDEVFSVVPSGVIAWTGRAPVGCVPRLSIRDLFLPRLPGNLTLSFVGPCHVWFEGGAK